MSTTNPIQQSLECGQCKETFDGLATAGSFCSPDCYDAHRRHKAAANIFETIEHDHRFCGTCFQQLKTVERPSEIFLSGLEPTTREAVIGLQFPTKHADYGEKSEIHDGRDLVRTGTICECGNTDHQHQETAIRNRQPFSTGCQLTAAICELQHEGKLSADLEVNLDHLQEAILGQTIPVEEGGVVNIHRALEEALVL
ncbi:hypothetical protein [Natrononativus amylolyticus]|uniref:hypothetical protein n=1 Tax=Natrononativus amylolyticus TaxID=2963434 RepID=UPI0020CEB509|nr:hypothetical protein [Natrononativus amylolyticus]